MSHTPKVTTRKGAKTLPTPIERVVVAAGSPASGARLYSVAVRLAQLCEAYVDALFVEDAALVHLASLPFARVVNFESAQIEPLDLAALSRQMQSDADRLRALFLELVGDQAASSSFSVLQGRVCDELLAQVRARDLLVCALNESHLQSLLHLGKTAAGLLSRAPCSIWLDRGPEPAWGNIVAVVDAFPVSWCVIRQAAYWAGLRRLPVVYAISEKCPDKELAARQIRDFMREAEIYDGRVSEGVPLEKVLDSQGALVVLDAAQFRSAPDLLRRWLMLTNLPLLLVSDD